MNNTGHEGMNMETYSFMGLHLFWWVTILIVMLLILAFAHKYRKRK